MILFIMLTICSSKELICTTGSVKYQSPSDPRNICSLKLVLCEGMSHFLVPRGFVLLETGARSASLFSCTRPAATLAQ